MRKLVPLLVAALAAAAVAALGPAVSVVDAGGAPTTDIYVVHGLNLSGQTAQGDGGTAVTVCNNDNEVDPDFQFGEIALVPLPSGADVAVQVYLGAGVDCANPGAAPAIDQTVTVPGSTAALVATAGPQSQGPELLAIALNAECADSGTGRLTGVHAANAGTVDVLINGDVVTQLAYGEKAGDEEPIPVSTYSVQINLGNTPIVGPADIPVDESINRIVYVVGNQPDEVATPVVPLIQDLPIEVCEVPTPEPESEEQPPPPAGVVEARPTFTG